MARSTKTKPAAAPEPKPALTPAEAARMNTLSPAKTDLAIIAEHRHGLYKWPQKGFATHDAGPFLPLAAGQALIDLGLCEFEPSGGQHGAIKITPAGREALKAVADA